MGHLIEQLALFGIGSSLQEHLLPSFGPFEAIVSSTQESFAAMVGDVLGAVLAAAAVAM